jgi:lysophospholipase L1-like esterase
MAEPQRDTTNDESFSLRKRLIFGALAVGVAAMLTLVLAEGLLRVLPIPGIAYQTFYYDELTGGHHYPNSTIIYRGADGRKIERKVNDWGFLDVDHELEKPEGTIRVGFFGDSYLEARQVELEETFYQLLQQAPLAQGWRDDIEILAFGVAGRSTLQSYLECARWLDRVDLDLVVYVFSENDPGDQIRGVAKVDVVPFAELSGDTFVIDNAFREPSAHKTSWWHRTLQFLKARSLVMSTVEQRLRLLRRHGVVTHVADGTEGREAGLRATTPSTWGSDSLVAHGKTLCGRVIAQWNREVMASGARFMVARVPRESQLHRQLREQDAWAPWLHDFCDENGIELIDPTSAFREAISRGEVVYGDHFTPAGHRVFAKVIGERLPGIDNGGIIDR